MQLAMDMSNSTEEHMHVRTQFHYI